MSRLPHCSSSSPSPYVPALPEARQVPPPDEDSAMPQASSCCLFNTRFLFLPSFSFVVLFFLSRFLLVLLPFIVLYLPLLLFFFLLLLLLSLPLCLPSIASLFLPGNAYRREECSVLLLFPSKDVFRQFQCGRRVP